MTWPLHNKLDALKGLLLLSVALLASCQALRPVGVQEEIPIPAKFADSLSAGSSGFIPPRHFFPDTNLINLINSAITGNFDLQKTIQRIKVAEASFFYSKRRFLPVINIGASAGVEKYGDYTMNGVGNYDSNLSPNLNEDQRIPSPTPDFFLGARSNWELGLWGKYKNAKKANLNRLLATKKARHFIITMLVADVATLYYDLLTLDNELLIIRKNLALQQSALQTIEEMKKGAMANELAVKQFRAQLLNTKALEISKQQEIIQSENRLNLLLGRLPQPVLRGKPIQSQPLPPNTQAGIPAEMLLRRPDIQQAELELQAAELDVKVAKAHFFPSLNITAYTGYNAFKAPLLFSTPASLVYGAASGLTAPLVNRGRIKANYNRSKALQLEAFYTYQKTIATSFQEVTTSLNGIKNYEKVYEIKHDEVKNLIEAVDVSRSLFMSGYASYLEVITAQRYVLQAELELTEIKNKQFDSVIELYRSLGGGWQ